MQITQHKTVKTGLRNKETSEYIKHREHIVYAHICCSLNKF